MYMNFELISVWDEVFVVINSRLLLLLFFFAIFPYSTYILYSMCLCLCIMYSNEFNEI